MKNMFLKVFLDKLKQLLLIMFFLLVLYILFPESLGTFVIVFLLVFFSFIFKSSYLLYKYLQVPENILKELQAEMESIVYYSLRQYMLLNNYIVSFKDFTIINYKDIINVDFWGIPGGTSFRHKEKIYMTLKTSKTKKTFFYCEDYSISKHRKCFKNICEFLISKNPKIIIEKNGWL